ncbi:TlpA disulfide reductase family protein [Flavivirga sp. 57AJ16]|uniref:TlpA disulfide reductase family protein n=1 Tax=Flavivirga sp. 57AJ16 TaxID=3025307 RepID=UPI0023652E0E|nr:TlpA disulfide reductase family protein [Flavivirga sp. 57AJ16]MDD7884560.1 TlpA disulfide reductase family protein [Flavivirga sp. 57AJ16]
MKEKMCLLWLVCFFSTAMAQKKEFTIKGHLTGANVPLKVFLYYRDGNSKFADSTMAKNNTFTFTGTIEHATQASIYAHWLYPNKAKAPENANEGIELMLDNGDISIEGEYLRTAQINGGKTQEEFIAYRKKTDSLGNAVYQIWKEQQDELPEDSIASFKRLIYARGKLIKETVKSFINTHPKSELSFSILQSNTLVIEDVEYVESILNTLRPEFGKFDRFKEIEQKVMLTKRLSIGQKAIDFTQSNDKGDMVSLSDMKGKYVLIDFWASWCGPCRMEYPYLKSAYKKYKNKNFEIIGISIDDKESLWLNAIKSNNFEWIQLSDLKGKDNAVAKMYGISAIPQNFLIDPQGKILAKNLRGDELNDKLKGIFKE